MNILLIDTCQQGLALGLKTDTGFFTYVDSDYRAQAEIVLLRVSVLLDEADCNLAKIDLLGVTRGPGAFTGLRVGISAAQGLALAHHLPVVAISSLQWIAQTAARVTGQTEVLVARDARMQAIYWGRYHANKSAIMMPKEIERLSKPDVLKDSVDSAIAAGDAWQHYADSLPVLPHSGVLWGELVDLLTLVEADWQAGLYCYAETLTPVYLRDDVVS
jgi:tRNA threonylcarbamoyladenosine biosynthesis protein TsaB